MKDGRPSTIGRAAIMHFYGGLIHNGITRFSYKTTGVWGSGNNLIAEEGTAIFAFTNGKAAVKGGYLPVWRRENGVLKIFRDVFVSDVK